MIINNILFFVLTYFLFGLIIVAFLRTRFSAQTEILPSAEIFILGLGLGPITVSLILYFLFLFFPARANLFYIVTVAAVFMLLMLFSAKNVCRYLKEIIHFIASIGRRLKFIEKDAIVMFLFIFIIVLYIFIQGVGFPILSDDGSFYGCVGRYFYEHKNVSDYPFVTPDPRTGAYLNIEHPPGLTLLYAWFYMLSGGFSSDVLPRTTSPIYAAYILILLFLILKRKENRYCGIFGVLLMVLTPLFVWQSYENSIDPIRIFFIFSSFVLLAQFLKAESTRSALLVGATAGFAMYIHAAGILAFMVVIALYLLLSKENIGHRFKYLVVIGATALAVGGTQYIMNYSKYHNILGSASYSLFDPTVKKFYSSQELLRTGQTGAVMLIDGIKISKKLVFGRLQMFTRPELFGFSYYIFLFAVFYRLKYIRKKKIDVVILLSAILFAIPVIYKFYSNRRYIFTIHPLIIYFGGLALGEIYARLKEKKEEIKFWLVLFVLILIPIIVFFIPGSMASVKLFGDGKDSKLKYLFANKKEQNRILAPGLWEATEYINLWTPKNSVVLTFSQSRYFYYSERKGVYWSEPRMNSFYRLKDKKVAHQYLLNLGIDYIMIDILYERDPRFKDSQLKAIVEDTKLSKLVFIKDTRVYLLAK